MNQFDTLKNANGEIDKKHIKEVIPYDDPFLFVDKITSLTNNRIVAEKELSGKEDFFKGHFVGFPIMPGALTIEGLGQTATFLARSNMPNHQEKDVLAYKLKDVKFMSPILPGSQLRYEVELIAQDEKGAIFHGKVFVKDNLVAEAFFVVAIVNKSEFRAKFN